MDTACTVGTFCVKTVIITEKVKIKGFLLPLCNYFSKNEFGSAKRFAKISNEKRLQIVTVKICNFIMKNFLKDDNYCLAGKNIYKKYPKISERFVLFYKKD